MKLQLALDDITIDEAVALVDRVRPFIDIVEVGTPFLIEDGLRPVRDFRARYPDLPVLADVKIMDAGHYEARQAFAAGAAYVTVLGVTDLLTVKGCLDVAADFGGIVVADMICVADLPDRIRRLEDLGIKALAVHTGVDQQAAGRTPADELKVMKEVARQSELFVAGGITPATISQYIRLGADVAIVGGGIRHAADPAKAAEELARLAHQETKEREE
ncbi:3-hexulose-6-phosphate synthase [uncultured Pleomorphomonas sp.]|uniref:3-hexulose-6-phosphate synthase n=1 Tax=uncultured Pleomorphomonas sp. TaxID=442121 RepID=A0A212LLR8_9HYPH|nr:3-hexulose-6-phosphate synthase [uncultured Pleomorphomonas sp.]SCM78349.1 3-hexulose-6-phosphate synthase [uncultured Pleomorphomonas sp.]